MSSSTPAAVILEPHNYPLPAPMLCQASGPSHQCPETPVKISRCFLNICGLAESRRGVFSVHLCITRSLPTSALLSH
ncbi:gag-pol polyprotein, partial [Moniliophthora roreri]